MRVGAGCRRNRAVCCILPVQCDKRPTQRPALPKLFRAMSGSLAWVSYPVIFLQASMILVERHDRSPLCDAAHAIQQSSCQPKVVEKGATRLSAGAQAIAILPWASPGTRPSSKLHGPFCIEYSTSVDLTGKQSREEHTRFRPSRSDHLRTHSPSYRPVHFDGLEHIAFRQVSSCHSPLKHHALSRGSVTETVCDSQYPLLFTLAFHIRINFFPRSEIAVPLDLV